MTKNPDQLVFFKAKESVMENLEELRLSLDQAVEEGMLDPGDHTYNQCVALQDELPLVENWDDLEEVIVRGKDLEQLVVAWISMHGRETLSMDWPSQKSK